MAAFSKTWGCTIEAVALRFDIRLWHGGWQASQEARARGCVATDGAIDRAAPFKGQDAATNCQLIAVTTTSFILVKYCHDN